MGQVATQSVAWIKKASFAVAVYTCLIVFILSVFIGGMFVVTRLFPDQEWALRWRYAAYNPDLEHAEITVEKKPHNCEFMSAPVGNKHCRYEMNVSTMRMRNDQNGHPWISFDDGKTWGQPEGNSFQRPQIVVTWTKVED